MITIVHWLPGCRWSRDRQLRASVSIAPSPRVYSVCQPGDVFLYTYALGANEFKRSPRNSRMQTFALVAELWPCAFVSQFLGNNTFVAYLLYKYMYAIFGIAYGLNSSVYILCIFAPFLVCMPALWAWYSLPLSLLAEISACMILVSAISPTTDELVHFAYWVLNL